MRTAPKFLLAAALAAAATAAAAMPAPGEPTLDEIRRLTERFRDVDVAYGHSMAPRIPQDRGR